MAHFIASKGTITAVDYALAYLMHVYKHHGVASGFISDRDTLLTADVYTEFCKLLKIRQQMSTAGHPETDGQSERTIETFEEMVRHFISYHGTDWDDYLPFLEFAYNDSVHVTTGYTPFFLNYGEHPASISDLMLDRVIPDPQERNAKIPAARRKANHLFIKMRVALKRAKSALESARSKMIMQLGLKRRKPDSYKPGDMVLISRNHLSKYPDHERPAKFQGRFYGPVPIVAKRTDNVYEVDVSQDPAISRIHNRINVANLKLWRTTDRFRQELQAPEPVEVDSHREYVIDHIIDDRWSSRRRRYEYLTMWKGYPITAAKWIPIQNFTGSAIRHVHHYLKHQRALNGRPELPGPGQAEEVERAMQPYINEG
jgi:hypothetical protein